MGGGTSALRLLLRVKICLTFGDGADGLNLHNDSAFYLVFDWLTTYHILIYLHLFRFSFKIEMNPHRVFGIGLSSSIPGFCSLKHTI